MRGSKVVRISGYRPNGCWSRYGYLFWWVVDRITVFNKVGVEGFARVPDRSMIVSIAATHNQWL